MSVSSVAAMTINARDIPGNMIEFLSVPCETVGNN